MIGYIYLSFSVWGIFIFSLLVDGWLSVLMQLTAQKNIVRERERERGVGPSRLRAD